MSTPPLPWTCPSCKKAVNTRFCAVCGEESVSPHDLSLRGLVEKLIHAFTSIDVRVVRTAWTLLRRPGQITLSWMEGIRKPYIAPFQLFLIANVIFFALQSLIGMNIFSSSLESHLEHQDWSELALSLLTHRLEKTGTSLEHYAPVFDHAVVVNAKSLILLMTIPFAMLLPAVFLRKHQPFMAHVVFSLHLYTFLLLLFCAVLILAKISALAGIGGLDVPQVDNVLSVINLVACTLYIYLAIGPVYGATGIKRTVQAVVLAFSIGAIVLGYRFLLFLITLYST